VGPTGKNIGCEVKGRASAGITNGRVFRNADDANEVVVLQDLTDAPIIP
jgi:hypothetical protein